MSISLPALCQLSEHEIQYIVDGIASDLRADGRTRKEFRHLELETGIVGNANGSARVRLEETDILVGVKVEVGEPEPETPDCGSIEFGVQFASSASTMLTSKAVEAYGASLSSLLDRIATTGSVLDLKQLCIISGSVCYALKVDVLILQCGGGGLHDATAAAVFAALRTTELPSFRVIKDSDGDEVDWEPSEDPALPLACKQFPVLVTLASVNDYAIVDASVPEQTCADVIMHIAVDASGAISTTVLRSLTGGLPPTLLTEMIAMATQAGKKLLENINAAIGREEAMSAGSDKPLAGFLRS